MNPFEMPSRRDLLTSIGKVGGAAALYQAITVLGHAQPTQFQGPPKLSGAKAGASVIILGAGLAGMAAAYEPGSSRYKGRKCQFTTRVGRSDQPPQTFASDRSGRWNAPKRTFKKASNIGCAASRA